MIALDSENFSDNVILTVPSNTCFNMSNLPTQYADDPTQLYYYICKNECDVDLAECCIIAHDFEKMKTDEFTVEELSCIGNEDPKFGDLCERQELRLQEQ